MRRVVTAAALVAVAVLVVAAAPAPQPYKNSPGPNEVATALLDWKDAARDREVPAKVYHPKQGAGPFPLIIFSHGLGGSREGYEYLGRHWASHGYISVHVTHRGSDTEVWKGSEGVDERMKRMRAAIADPRAAIDRLLDVAFAIDRMTKLGKEDSPFKGRIDLDRIGVAGHSFGAWTTLAVAGEGSTVLGRGRIKLADPRVKAAIAMSAPAPASARGLGAYAGIHIPVFHMTGTLDASVVGDTTAAERRIPFDRISGIDQYLVTFEGGDHMIFSGVKRLPPKGEKDPVFRDLILQCSTAFWDACLRGDAKAKAWLAEGGFEKVLDRDGKFEKKLEALR